MGPFSKCCSRKSPAITTSTSRYDIETGRKDKVADRSKAEATKVGNKAQHHIDVPKTFDEMFQWNSAVMGLSGRKWMQEVLNSFTAMVEHISDTKRLQQECNVVSIRIAKTSGDNVSLSEFKSCMLAALRSLLPTTWDTNHELAWNWLLGPWICREFSHCRRCLLNHIRDIDCNYRRCSCSITHR